MPAEVRAPAARPGVSDGLPWLTIRKMDGKWHVLELTNGVIRTVESAYYRDLAEQAMAKRMRMVGR